MLLSKNISRRWLSSLWRRTQQKPRNDASPQPSSAAVANRPNTYDGATVETLLQNLKKNAKLTNSKAFNPPSNVEEVIEKTVRNNLAAADKWRTQSLSDVRVKYKLLSELSAKFDCEVPNFLLSDIKTVEDVIAHFKSTNSSSAATSAGLNPLEQLGAMQMRSELPPNVHVQVEYDFEDDVRPKVFTGVDNVVTSIKYRRKYKGYAAKVKEPLV